MTQGFIGKQVTAVTSSLIPLKVHILHLWRSFDPRLKAFSAPATLLPIPISDRAGGGMAVASCLSTLPASATKSLKNTRFDGESIGFPLLLHKLGYSSFRPLPSTDRLASGTVVVPIPIQVMGRIARPQPSCLSDALDAQQGFLPLPDCCSPSAALQSGAYLRRLSAICEHLKSLANRMQLCGHNLALQAQLRGKARAPPTSACIRRLFDLVPCQPAHVLSVCTQLCYASVQVYHHRSFRPASPYICEPKSAKNVCCYRQGWRHCPDDCGYAP